MTATPEILRDIVESTVGSKVDPYTSLAAQLPPGGSTLLSERLKEELEVSVKSNEIDASNLADLAIAVESLLTRDENGQTLADTYAKLKLVASSVIYHWIDFRWFSSWDVDLFNESDSLERAELISRMEEEFAVSISDRDVEAMQTVAQTVRCLWRKKLIRTR